ncbi:CLUMA_CG014139, isoform A [Clunio marinus]|uniref:CLUMA_CG014139, isoform A n=1 Tax=Clunio marinus TaxID=568069 RepID=A0A1J1IL53_9DIPT|nr:CLUMA_CG014139, isoform A [Clunio marinus]
MSKVMPFSLFRECYRAQQHIQKKCLKPQSVKWDQKALRSRTFEMFNGSSFNMSCLKQSRKHVYHDIWNDKRNNVAISKENLQFIFKMYVRHSVDINLPYNFIIHDDDDEIFLHNQQKNISGSWLNIFLFLFVSSNSLSMFTHRKC